MMDSHPRSRRPTDARTWSQHRSDLIKSTYRRKDLIVATDNTVLCMMDWPYSSLRDSRS